MKTSKLKKRMSSGSSLTSKLPVYDKIIKMISKSHETIPLSRSCIPLRARCSREPGIALAIEGFTKLSKLVPVIKLKCPLDDQAGFPTISTIV
jgi:hypothetical protein